jgi:hypothetical protein
MLLALTAACSSGPTTLLLELNGPATLTSLDVSITLEGGSSASRNLQLGSTKLPGTLLVELPDRALGVTIDVVGHTSGGDLSAHTVVTSQPHHQLAVPIVLGAGPDLGTVDFSGSDSGSTVTPRLISNSYFSNWSGATFSFPSGMSRTNSAGVVDGDLLLVFASIDNGSDMVWPNPLAPGFNQLAQAFFGSDGETYVVAWKIASGEPATYTGSYGSGVNSGSAVISLIAVSGANRTTPINAFLAGYGSSGASPTIATSPGVTTTVPNCTLLYAAGADWLGTPGSNTFALPAGYSSLTQLGDRGDNNWDWTSQMVGWSPRAVAGATGAISGTLTSTTSGIPWTAVVAIAP